MLNSAIIQFPKENKKTKQTRPCRKKRDNERVILWIHTQIKTIIVVHTQNAYLLNFEHSSSVNNEKKQAKCQKMIDAVNAKKHHDSRKSVQNNRSVTK